jgi:hypothetical protein
VRSVGVGGDVAIDEYVSAYERAQKLFPRAGARPKTHRTLITVVGEITVYQG